MDRQEHIDRGHTRDCRDDTVHAHLISAHKMSADVVNSLSLYRAFVTHDDDHLWARWER